MKEIWKDICEYEEKYQVSNLGNVRNKKTKLNLKQQKNEKGYLKVNLCKNSKIKKYRVHRLVAKAFIPNPNGYMEINHKDENKTNNCVGNLEWCSHIYNSNYGNRNAKISQTMSTKVNQYDLKGNFIKRWESIKEICNYYKIDKTTIQRCCNGIQKKSHKYIWKYEGD